MFEDVVDLVSALCSFCDFDLLLDQFADLFSGVLIVGCELLPLSYQIFEVVGCCMVALLSFIAIFVVAGRLQ